MASVNITNCESNSSAKPGTRFEMIFDGLITSTVALCGCFGNLLSIYMLHASRYAGRSLGYTITSLAIWDTLLLVAVLGYYSLANLFKLLQMPIREDLQLHWSLIFQPVIVSTYAASAWLTMAITVQRYLAVRSPFHFLKNCDHCCCSSFNRVDWMTGGWLQRQWKHVALPVAISLAAILVSIPSIFTLKVMSCWDGDQGMLRSMLNTTEVRSSSAYMLWYRLVLLKLVLTNSGPCLLIPVLAMGILRELRKVYMQRPILVLHRRSSEAAEEAQHERMMTIILTMVSVKFVLSHSLPAALDFWECFFDFRQQIQLFRLLVSISNFLVVLNSSSNFLVYISGRQFLSCHLIGHCCRPNGQRGNRHLFTNEELARLELSWESFWESTIRDPVDVEMAGCPLGVQIIQTIAERRPIISQYFVGSNTGRLEGSDQLLEHNGKMVNIVMEAINGLQAALKTGNMEIAKQVRRSFQQLGESHHQLGLSFTADMWKVFKETVVTAARCDESFHDREETARVWAKLVSLIIYEMKLGLLKQATAHCRPSLPCVYELEAVNTV